uniref:Uncharacterized protein n=1 Tax=Vitis vinifera TaxID=29760 RepID=A5AVN2_VITVI|nr:hypothetical protein VITISV_011457 [Vitis vinifera]
MQRREHILMALFRIVSGQWWTPAELFMAVLFYFEDKILVMDKIHPQDHQLPPHQKLFLLSQIRNAAAYILASLSSTPNIGPSSSDGYVHVSAEAFNQLLARLDMTQENQANIQLTQQQLVQRVDELTMVVQ